MFFATALLGCLLSAPPDAAPEQLAGEVRRLVRQLDASQLAQRDDAERAIIGLGAAALDVLPAENDRMSAEVKTRLRRVRQSLQRKAAEAAAASSTINLSAAAMPLSEILAEFQRQSGNPIVDYRKKFGQVQTDPKLVVDFKDTPFWQALDRVLDQAELTVYPFGDQRAVLIVARPAGQLPRAAAAAYGGPFRFAPVAIAAKRDLRTAGAESLLLTEEISWEPRVRPMILRQPLSSVRAVDENGKPIEAADAKAGIEATAGEDKVAVELALPLVLPPRATKEIAQLKATLSAVLPGKIESFTFDDLTKAKNVEKRVAGTTVTLEEVRKNGDIYQVRIRVRFDEAGEALQSHRGWIFKNPAYLEDEQGKPIPYDIYETTRQTKNELGIAYCFALDAPPEKMKFVYKTPTLILPVDIEYTLKGVKLP